jgi:DNA polymerase-1
MGLFWPEDAKKGKKFRPNPKPPIPKTGWKMRNRFPDLSGAGAISFDVETYDPHIKLHGPGWGRGVGHLIGVAVATDDGFEQYYPMRHDGYQNHNPHDVLDWCREQLGRPEQPKIGHNILYDLGWLEHEGVRVRGEIHDTFTASKLLSHEDEASLESLGQRILGEGKTSEMLYDWCWRYWGHGAKPKSAKELREVAASNFYRCPPELIGYYAESDVRLPIQLAAPIFEMLEADGLWDVYRLECDLIPVLVQMRLLGVSVDLDAAEQAREALIHSADDLQAQIDEIAGRPVNTGSPVEMEKVFQSLKIPIVRTANGKMSLKGELLKALDHPLGQLIVDLEEIKKYRSTFVENAILGSHVNGRVHGQFNPLRAVTGRMSASDPNLQQIPSRNDLAKKIRSIFIPDEGHDHWRKYDYSSIESRILAHDARGAGAKALRKEYRDNPDTDYHNFCLKMVAPYAGWDITTEDGMKKWRKPVKTINFGILYGMMVNALARRLGIGKAEAEDLFNTYHDGLPYVRETMEYYSTVAGETGEIRTILNRRSLFNRWEPIYQPRGQDRPMALKFDAAVRAYGPNIRRAYLHKALNYRIQGSAADLMKSAMVQCHKQGIYDRIGFPRLVVHDEKDWSVAPDWDEEAFTEMQRIMETAIKFRVPIKVEGEWGPNWSELYPLR